MSKRLTTEQFIERAKCKHGDRFGYELVDYKNLITKVKIRCNIHGYFNQKAQKHLEGLGCNKCRPSITGSKLKSSNHQFIEKSRQIHGDRYDYSLVQYIGANDKVLIKCKIHGVFKQTPSNHILKTQPKGCPSCAISERIKLLRLTKEEFLDKANLVHSGRYGYDFVDYIDAKTKVKIKCYEHGFFIQSAGSHLRGNGCPKCSEINNQNNPVGWTVTNWEKASKRSKVFDSFKVYIIRCWNDDEEFYKIGRTFTTIKKRFRAKSMMPYNYEILEEIIFDNARDCFNAENNLKRLNKSNKYIPLIHFNGNYECFSKLIKT